MTKPAEQRREAAPPGGRSLALAKIAAERVLWTRVRVQRLIERHSAERPRRLPDEVPPTATLQDKAQWESAFAEARRLRLPVHHDHQKNWDALGAVSTIVRTLGPEAAVLDAGSARYSSILPWLRLYGFSDLVGNNLEFNRTVRRDGVIFQYGDITKMDFPDARFGAVTCMSVIEHGVPLEALLAEQARILKRGGMLIVSTDYDQNPVDTTGHEFYGSPVHIFSPEEIKAFVATAKDNGLQLKGELSSDHRERPVYWKRLGLRYTCIRLTFVKS